MGIANITNNILTDSGAVIGAANGVATLDSGGKIPVSQLPNSVMEFKGTWSAATNNPTLANGTGNAGDVYEVSAAGTVNFGAGGIAFALGDYVVYDGTSWQYSSGQKGTVTSLTFSAPLSGGTITTSGTVSIPAATSSVDGYLKATDWVIFNGKQNALTNPVTGTGTANYLPKFTGASTIGNSTLQTDASGNLGLGIAPSAWGSILKAFQLGNYGAYIAGRTDSGGISQVFVGANSYYDGANWVYTNSTFASRYYQADGAHNWQTSASGTSGGTITWTPAMTLSASGNLLINTTTDAGYKLDVNGTGRFTGDLSGTSASFTGGVNLATSSGNVGIGVTPSTWTGTNVKALQFGNSGALANSGTFGTILFNNSYYNSGYKYITSNSASAYVQDGNTHLWYQAPSGTAGTTISFTQAMTLNASGNLVIGNTSVTNSAGYTRIFNVYDTSSAAVGISIASNDYQLGVESDGGFRIRYNGSARLTMSNTGAATFSSSVDVNSYIRNTNSGANAAVTIAADGTSHYIQSTNAARTVYNKLLLNPYGANVGIGSTTADVPFEIHAGRTTDPPSLGAKGGTIAMLFNDSANGSYGLLMGLAGANVYLQNQRTDGDATAYNLLLQPRGGNVGIGTTSPNALLHLTQNATNLNLYLQNTNGSGKTWAVNSDNLGSFNIHDTTANRLTITTGGNVGIGTTTVNVARLEVVGAIPTFFTADSTASSPTYGGSIFYRNHTGVGQGNGLTFSLNDSLNSRAEYAYIGGLITANTNGSHSGAILFAPSSSGNRTERMLLNSSGVLAFNSNSSPTGGGYDKLSIGFQDGVDGWIQTWGGRPLSLNSQGNNVLIGTRTDNGARLQVAGVLAMGTTGTNYIRMGVFPNSTGNNGEAWIGRAADRTVGTMTVQLGGGSASSRSFEVVDYAWSVVLFSVGSNGNGTFNGSVTATSFFESSDKTIKTLIEDNYQTKGIESVVAKLYTKNGKEELGYFAQDVQGILPSAVIKGTDGLLSLSYREVHTAKIARLEKRVAELEEQLNLK